MTSRTRVLWVLVSVSALWMRAPAAGAQTTTTAPATSTTTAVAASLGRLVIPKIKVDVLISEDVNGPSLAAGVGHYPHTPIPGDFGNAGIAGHRGVAPAPFARLSELAVGDEVRVQRPPAADTVFKVDSVAVLGVTDPAILAPATVPVLTLTAAQGDGNNQIVVRAVLEGSTVSVTTLPPLTASPSTSRPPLVAREGGESPGLPLFYGSLVLLLVAAGAVRYSRSRR